MITEVRRPGFLKRIRCAALFQHRLRPSGFRNGKARCWCGDHRSDAFLPEGQRDYWLGDPEVIARLARQRRTMEEIVRRESGGNPTAP